MAYLACHLGLHWHIWSLSNWCLITWFLTKFKMVAFAGVSWWGVSWCTWYVICHIHCKVMPCSFARSSCSCLRQQRPCGGVESISFVTISFQIEEPVPSRKWHDYGGLHWRLPSNQSTTRKTCFPQCRGFLSGKPILSFVCSIPILSDLPFVFTAIDFNSPVPFMNVTSVIYSHSSAVKDEVAKNFNACDIKFCICSPGRILACELAVQRTDNFSYVL